MNITESRKIKLVLVIADSDLGGGPKHVLGILKNINKKKYECFLICPNGSLASFAREIKGVTVLINKFGSKFDLISAWAIYDNLHKIQSLGHPFSPMIVHFHGARAGFLGRIFLPKHITTIYTEHSLDKNFHLKNKFNEYIQKKILARQNRKTNLIIAVSSSVKEYLLGAKLSPAERTIVLSNGIELDNFGLNVPARKIKVGNHHPVIGSIGNLNPQKGYEYLVKAMPEVLKAFPLATLEIVGEGLERRKLEKMVVSLKLGHHVSFLGKRININKHLLDFDVFVLPSVSETFGLVLLEAMKAGVPIVATAVGGITDVVEEGKSGLLIEPRNPKQLSKNIITILKNPVLAAKLKRGGLERVKRYDWSEIIKNLEKIYHDLAISGE
ncbi:MAG: glycosyltransferase family 4 protein [bacterium]